MIVYRKTEEECATTELIGEVAVLAERAASTLTHEAATELLIETGRLEAGIVDAMFPEADGVNEQSAAARKMTIAAAKAFTASWDGRKSEMASSTERLTKALWRLRSMPLPWKIKTRVPEGFAHYGLFPEVYIKSARDFMKSERPEEAVCVGMRSIGTALSAVVAAVLEEAGCAVRSFTVRPKGHPFRRKARFSPMLEGIVKAVGGTYLVIDEGPGLSGSTFGSVVKKITSLGVDPARICLFPSWDPDPSAFISAEAREIWGRHRKYTSSFEDLWIKSGRLESEASADKGLVDLSAGMWRSMFFNSESDYPASHPRHEKRKYLIGAPHRDGSVLLKFAGHGKYGRRKLERAQRISEAGFGLPVSGICNGFMRGEFVYARPLNASDLNQVLLDEMAGYLAFLRRNFRADKGMEFDEFAHMASRNIALGLGEEWAGRAACLDRLKPVFEAGVPVEVDGRMLPMEWLLTRKGYKKADSVDHCIDQFFPSSQDIAWDLATTVIEFNMSPMEQHYFISKYSVLAKDEVSHERLRLHMIAYLAFRLGYASFAAEELSGMADGLKFSLLARQYASRLKRELLWITD